MPAPTRADRPSSRSSPSTRQGAVAQQTAALKPAIGQRRTLCIDQLPPAIVQNQHQPIVSRFGTGSLEDTGGPIRRGTDPEGDPAAAPLEAGGDSTTGEDSRPPQPQAVGQAAPEPNRQKRGRGTGIRGRRGADTEAGGGEDARQANSRTPALISRARNRASSTGQNSGARSVGQNPGTERSPSRFRRHNS